MYSNSTTQDSGRTSTTASDASTNSDSNTIRLSAGTKQSLASSAAPVDFITQTDAQGRALRRAEPASSSSRYDSTQQLNKVSATPSPKFKFFQWLCCFVGSKPNDFADDVDEYAHSRSRQQSIRVPSVPQNRANRKTPPSPSRGMPQRHPHIGPVSPNNSGKKCLVLDLDETLVHSSLREEPSAHLVIPVNIDNAIHNVFVIKRPGVDDFLKRMGEMYEIIIYTASLSKYADPLLDQLDVHKVISKRLYRENCVFHDGHYVKDLSLLNRDLCNTIIVDNSPMSYIFHPENAIDCGSFIDDPKDIEMWLIGDFLKDIKGTEDVRLYCRHWRDWRKKNPTQCTVPQDML